MYLNSLSGIYTTPTLFILQYFSVRTKDFSSEIWYNIYNCLGGFWMIKKIEITKLIDEKLTEYPIRYTDLMNKTYSINSYEKYIQEFSLIKSSFKDNIKEFFEIAENQINKIESLINDCDKTNIETAKQYIDNNFYNELVH